MPPLEVTIDRPRPAPGTLAAGWADKTDELLVKKPVYLRSWFLRLMLALLALAVIAGSVGGLFLYRWHREQQADLARQRRSVEAFVRSPAFETFAHEVDAQFVASLNYATLRPETVGALLPEIAAAEKARHQVPWPVELPLLPVSAAENPARVRAAMRTATDLLAQRGFPFERRTAEARRTFLRLLAPHVGDTVPALFLDRRMQDSVLAAYAARAGGTLTEAQQAFAFYALVGPALWRAIAP